MFRGAAVRVALAGLLALQLASCGGTATSEQDRVVDVIEKLQDDLAEGRIATVCAAMTDRSKRQVGTVGHRRKPTTCVHDLADLVAASRNLQGSTIKGLGETRKPDVVDLSIDPDGAAATAKMTLGKRPFDVAFAKEDGKWKLDDFFGAVGPTPRDLQ